MLRSLLGFPACSAFQRPYSSRECAGSEQASSIHRGPKVGRFNGEEGLVVGRHSTFLSREEHRVAAGSLFYKVEGKKHCVISKAILDN
jgi:hypothetical protein